jgi:hypothetical protein
LIRSVLIRSPRIDLPCSLNIVVYTRSDTDAIMHRYESPPRDSIGGVSIVLGEKCSRMHRWCTPSGRFPYCRTVPERSRRSRPPVRDDDDRTVFQTHRSSASIQAYESRENVTARK